MRSAFRRGKDMAKKPQSKSKPPVYKWYVFVRSSGSVERCIGTRLKEDGDLLEVYDGAVCNLSVQRNDVIDQWQQDRRVTKVGEQRIKAALLGMASAPKRL
jgi:hypothetical protein